MEAEIILQELRLAIVQQSSPWLNREAAAAYALVSTAEIDRLADMGRIKRYWLASLPRFKKEDIDRLIESGQMPKSRRGAKPKQTVEII